MSSAKVTSKGRITIPARVRETLGVEKGDLIEFVEMQDGVYVVVAAKTPIRRLKGLIPRPYSLVSIEDMNAAIAATIATSHSH